MSEGLKQKIKLLDRHKVKLWTHPQDIAIEADGILLDDVIAVLDEVTKQIQERIDREETVAKDYYGTFETELGEIHEYGAKVLRDVLAVLDGEKNP